MKGLKAKSSLGGGIPADKTAAIVAGYRQSLRPGAQAEKMHRLRERQREKREEEQEERKDCMELLDTLIGDFRKLMGGLPVRHLEPLIYDFERWLDETKRECVQYRRKRVVKRSKR
jgi:hypothetical protein